MKKIWFRAKRYGWGWGLPACWQGWVALVVYFGLLIAGTKILFDKDAVAFFTVYTFAITVGLVLVCWWKGEPPRWRWGKD